MVSFWEFRQAGQQSSNMFWFDSKESPRVILSFDLKHFTVVLTHIELVISKTGYELHQQPWLADRNWFGFLVSRASLSRRPSVQGPQRSSFLSAGFLVNLFSRLPSLIFFSTLTELYHISHSLSTRTSMGILLAFLCAHAGFCGECFSFFSLVLWLNQGLGAMTLPLWNLSRFLSSN